MLSAAVVEQGPSVRCSRLSTTHSKGSDLMPLPPAPKDSVSMDMAWGHPEVTIPLSPVAPELKMSHLSSLTLV